LVASNNSLRGKKKRKGKKQQQQRHKKKKKQSLREKEHPHEKEKKDFPKHAISSPGKEEKERGTKLQESWRQDLPTAGRKENSSFRI